MVEKNQLGLRLEYKPDATDLEKAVIAFDMQFKFRDLLEAVTEEAGATGKVQWVPARTVFDGADVDAQPIFDALVSAYERGRSDARSEGASLGAEGKEQ